LPSLDIAWLNPDRIGARAAQYFKVQGSSALWAPRFASRGALDVRGTSDRGRTRKPGSHCFFCSPNERAGWRLARPDNV